MIENLYQDKKSLRAILGKNPEWKELAKDCVSFAYALVKNGSIIPKGGNKFRTYFIDKKEGKY